MAKYENIRALAKKQLQAVTESSDRWKAFLRTAAIAYNYSFPNQLLIHEQSPTATAVADIAYWNNNAGRWVKRGAHGIAVFDTRANSSRLRYLFDISDTIPRAEIPEALPWVITDQNWRPVWDKIVADNHADSIQSALLMLSTSCVAQRSAMFTTALGKAIDGSSLQWAKLDEQRQLFLQLITQSCLYMAALRCGVDTARLDLSALESVNQFDTNRITLCLGSACQQAARPLMQQIGSITREIDSVARAEKVRYYGDKQEETNNTKEVNNGVHDGERLPNPGADAERATDAGNREVRQPAAEIPAGERPDDVRRDDAGGNAVPASGGDGQRSTPANRTDHADADAAEHRPEPADRPDGLDAVDERLAGPSRGTGDAADLQPVTQEPQAESDTTPSAFSVPISDLPPLSDELILGLLAKESSSRADNAAILEYFNEHPDLAERSAFCKHCYKQIYTYLFVDDHTVGFIRHDMYLELWEGNYLTKTAQVNLTWDAVAAKIADLIEQGRLIVPIKAAPVQQQMEQLTLTPEDSEKAGLPSHEQQAKNIDLAAEAKKWNKPIIDASGKYITEQDITDALCKGGGFEDSKFRIQQYLSAQVLPIEEDQARWLKKEYGIGGGTWFFRDGGHGFLDHMGKNLEITRRTEDGEYRRVLKWKEVAQRLRLLVYNDQYLTDAEKATYQAWAAEQQAARAANDAALDHAKHAITDFCENEGLNEPNFSDLTRVEFAYSTTEDDEHEIQVYANLLRNEIRYEVDGNIVHIDYFHDNHELAAQGIENSAFSDFINTAEAEFEKHHPTTRKVEKSPVTIGSTVYLEDARPFTVEEIGRENIHLRDESFPLVGRAVSHEEFARLLAANPKNAALSAPEVPSRQEQPEETAEPIVGEVIEEPSPFVAQVMADAERLSAEDEPWFMPTDKGILAYHIIQSFSPGEATPEQVHQIGCEFARRFLADRFECTVSTHLDKGHLHNHIVTNSVSFIDGRMFRNDFDTYYKGIRKISDELCRENRLSVIETDGKGQGYADWLSGKTGKPTIRSMVRKDVELAMAAADTFDGFVAELQGMGYMVKYGPRVEHMAVRHQSAQRSVRIDRLDARYSESALRDYYRQLRHLPSDMRREYKAQHVPEPAQWLPPELTPVGKQMRCRSSLSKPNRKVSGFMACYYRYCALLRKAYHGKATKRCYFLLREDFKRFNRYQQQTHLLWEHRLQTLAEVQAHKSNLENQIEQLARQRKVLYRQKQEPERAAREEQIQKLTKQIKALRHEFYICADIEADAAMVQEKLRQAELAAQQERNEVKEDEYKRRSSRPDGARGASVFRGGY